MLQVSTGSVAYHQAIENLVQDSFDRQYQYIKHDNQCTFSGKQILLDKQNENDMEYPCFQPFRSRLKKTEKRDCGDR